jgi:hypothetical protein
MKHLLNNLTEQEKNAIREQHTGGMKVINENFSKLINSKLGDSKPLVNEQTIYNAVQAAASKPQTTANPNQPQYGGYGGLKQTQPQNQTGNDRISNLASIMRTIQTKQVPQQVIVNPTSKVNNMSWNDYVAKFKITPQEIDQANALLAKMGQTSPIKGSTPSTPTNGSAATGGGKLPTGVKPTIKQQQRVSGLPVTGSSDRNTPNVEI